MIERSLQQGVEREGDDLGRERLNSIAALEEEDDEDDDDDDFDYDQV